MSTLSRRTFVAAASAAGTLASLRPVSAARRYVIKFGVDLAPDHPTTLRAIEAGKEITAATKGAVELQVFPSSQLGNDTHMLAEIRSGAIQMMAIGDNILATLVPTAAIDNVGFAFKDTQTAWKALDGAVGDIVRADIERIGLHPMKMVWDEGFRQITTSNKPINTPDDLHGLKIRVPPSPISESLFQSLGASPVSLNIAELYTALQTGVVQGQENPLSNISTQKFYEVQKYCSVTNHMWVGYWLLMNANFWAGLPAKYQAIVENAFNRQAPLQRADSDALNNSLEVKLTKDGLRFNTPDTAPFRAALVQAGFYRQWQGKFGDKLWSALEQYTGTLS